MRCLRHLSGLDVSGGDIPGRSQRTLPGIVVPAGRVVEKVQVNHQPVGDGAKI